MTQPPVEIELSQQALVDVEDSALFIGRDDAEAARQFLQAIEKLLRQLSYGPEIGPRVPVLDSADIRAVTIPRFRSYRAFYVYDATRNRLRVLRILHTARDFPVLVGQ